MAKGSNGNRESEDRNEEGRNGRGGREGNGIGYTKNIRRDGSGRDQRSRGEGSNGRRRERKPKDSSSGSLTTPTPDHLSKSFYQAPVILERRPQTSSVSTPQVPDKGEEEGSSQTTFHPPVRIFRDDSFNRASSVNAPRVETKPMTFKGKPFDKPFVKMINEKGVLNHESVLKNQPLRPKGEYIGFTYLNAPDTFIVLAESLRNQLFQLPKKAGKKGQ
ncbi:83_t:CDS:2, partial [Racocetra fulgida]